MKTSLLSTLITLLLLAACESGTEPGSGTLPPEAPLTNIALTRGAGEQWESITNSSYFHLYVKDATGTEKHAWYTYTNGQWTPVNENNKILCGNQTTYPAYAYGTMYVTYATGNVDQIPVAWHGNLSTTVQPTEGTATATLPINILTARIHVSIIGAYGETPAELPDFIIQTHTRPSDYFSIPADPYTQPITVATGLGETAPWPLSYNNGYSPGDIVPQTIAAGSTFLTISGPDSTDPVYGTTEFTVIAPADIVLEAGKEYHYTIRLKGNGAQAEIVTEPTIAPFNPGSENNIRYQGILTEADLRQFSTDWNADPAAALAKWEDTPGSRIIRLLGDIEMTGSEGFTPIGIYPNSFNATFDGGGHTITGLHIDAGTGDDAALFARNSGVIYGLHLRGAEIKGHDHIAGLAAHNANTIASCSFGGTVTATGGTAGSIAANNHGTIAGCYSVATEVSAPSYAGGIAGYNNATGTLTACHWLTDSGQPAEAAGWNDGGTITDCHAIATPAQLYNNPQYVSLMNAALDALPTDRQPPYRWVQIPGGEPVLLPTP